MKDVLIIDHAADKPQTDFRLMRLVEWAGMRLSDFSRHTVSDYAPWERGDADTTPSVLFTLGPRALEVLDTGKVLDKVRGYVNNLNGIHHIPTVGPGFIQRGNSRWSAPFIHDLQKAVKLAAFGMPPQVTDYTLDPLPYVALDWAREYLRALAADPTIRLAFDIETPGKGEDEEDVDTDSDAPDRTWTIHRIGFSYKPLHALSIPWEPAYLAAIRCLCESAGDKVVWNAGFDVPRIRRTGIALNGTIHDGMVAWHILHTDLPKRLGFVATFTCPWQPAWKHLSGARPAFYNATDADVELRSMIEIEAELRKTGLWEVYEHDVLDLDPILVHMQIRGMPVDNDVRLDRAIKLADEQLKVRQDMQNAVPLEARKIDKVFVKTPKDTIGLQTRPGTRLVPRCAICGAERPRKDHFKRFVKKFNPCADGSVHQVEQVVEEYYRLAEFTPSRDQLMRYHAHLGRPNPMIWDKKAGKRKVSFGAREILGLTGRYPDDTLYKLILQYRKLDKLAGTYIGRVEDVI